MNRKPISFRLPAQTVASLRRQADQAGMTLTQYLILLVDRSSRERESEFSLTPPNKQPISLRGEFDA